MRNAVVLRHPDKAVQGRAAKYGYTAVVSDGWDLPAERTLFAAPGISIPYDLLAAGWHFLERWEVAAPLWRYGVLAQDVGTLAERKRTEAITLDLRMLLYAHELLFVRDCEGGRAFLAAWLEECQKGQDKRLAFLRALHRVKPLFCALPRSWLAEEQQRAAQDARSHIVDGKSFAVRGGALTEVRPQHRPAGLVQVEIEPGRFVLCRPGEEETTRARFILQKLSRAERRLVSAGKQ